MTFEEIEKVYGSILSAKDISRLRKDMVSYEQHAYEYASNKRWEAEDSVLHFQASLMIRMKLIKNDHGA